MAENDLTEIINQELGLLLPEKISADEMRRRMSIHLNHLIEHDFKKLVSNTRKN